MNRERRYWPWILFAVFLVNFITVIFFGHRSWISFVCLGGLGVVISLIWVGRSRAEALARESRQRLELAVNAARMGIWSYDCVHASRYLDAQSCHILGIDPQTYTGQPQEFFQVIHPDDLDRVKAAIARALAENIPYEMEYRVVLADGNFRHVVSRGRVVCDGHGRPARIDGVTWDETDRRNRETRQKLFLEVQQALNSSRDMASSAHDIVNLIRQELGADAVGLRVVLDGDFPYFSHSGFPDDFIKAEQFLCVRGDDGKPLADEKGKPVLACICGQVIAGRIDPDKPFFTPGGSFWTSHAAELAAVRPTAALALIPAFNASIAVTVRSPLSRSGRARGSSASCR